MRSLRPSPVPLLTESVVAECAAFCPPPGDEQNLGCLMTPIIRVGPMAMPQLHATGCAVVLGIFPPKWI